MLSLKKSSSTDDSQAKNNKSNSNSSPAGRFASASSGVRYPYPPTAAAAAAAALPKATHTHSRPSPFGGGGGSDMGFGLQGKGASSAVQPLQLGSRGVLSQRKAPGTFTTEVRMAVVAGWYQSNSPISYSSENRRPVQAIPDEARGVGGFSLRASNC